MFGFLNCNKPVGFSSRDLVNVVQGRLRGRKVKVGHCGTLDPLASGVLVVGVGPAAKLVPFVHESSKSYRATFRLGAESPTGDLEHEPTVYPDHPVPTLESLAAACSRLTGLIEQIPPAYSAIKVDGKRAYKMARQGHDVAMPTRTVQVDAIEILAYDYPDLQLMITCGTGTYIRTLGMDVAKAVGTVAVMTSLVRTRVGEFSISDAVSLQQLRENELESLLLPAALGVSHLPRLTVNPEDCKRLSNGLCLGDRNPESTGAAAARAEHVAAVTDTGHLKAILVQKRSAWCPKRVFPDK
ncbi:tRNA pseudouridine(55) synthase TruB [Stieleria mannarensis]|uniref:tRNA pseudouridine(55) synthase TruB n=1 Tax=Stieleria mannarensis TaxID=2755585 RepID=UPI001603AF39|nr:tRNA pseudouridine(55) synthase TruB [Rhodopirellula sp. JC639]